MRSGSPGCLQRHGVVRWGVATTVGWRLWERGVHDFATPPPPPQGRGRRARWATDLTSAMVIVRGQGRRSRGLWGGGRPVDAVWKHGYLERSRWRRRLGAISRPIGGDIEAVRWAILRVFSGDIEDAPGKYWGCSVAILRLFGSRPVLRKQG